MKTSLLWINDYLDQPIGADELQQVMTHAGFPVEEVDPVELSSGGSDTKLDVEVTSNRGDCMSQVGIAREIAASTERELVEPTIELQSSGAAASDLTQVAVDVPELCPIYSARIIQGVKVGPSPQWLQDKLESVGLRPVNNVVDVTNFVLYEMGQPLHAFDFDKLSGKQIIVRKAKSGEKFTAIDGTKHKLSGDEMVIADAEQPVAIAGVMGGLDSEVSESTTDILLESAIFVPLSVRKTARKLKLFSDSSSKFERGIDPHGVERASQRAAAMIAELAGGTVAEGVVTAGNVQTELEQVTMRTARCRSLLGIELDVTQQAGFLQQLGFSPEISSDQSTITCTIPSYRLDLHREVDLIEEIVRLYGMENVPTEDRLHLVVKSPQEKIKAHQKLVQTMVAHGYHETITPSFIAEKEGQAYCPQAAGVGTMQVTDDRRRTDPFLRASVLPSLLAVRKLNQDRGNTHVRLFEVASSFATVETHGKKQTRETRVLSSLTDAYEGKEGMQQAVREAKAAITDVVRSLGGETAVSKLTFETCDDSRFDTAVCIKMNGEDKGRLGAIAQASMDQLGLQTPVVLTEMDYEPVVTMYPAERSVGDLPRFPAIERDLSIVVDEAIAWAQVETAVSSANPAMMETLSFVTVYRGKPIAKGKKSVSLRMAFRDPQRTLRHEEVDPQVAAVVKALESSCGAELRA